ncbi:Fungal transcriptional regulatory protein [Cordyceps fumosorosea ARSEF 2679]|uniref:Fungal transcriptional regulatory protein n=1 Tax=Cordyceps fumosorosea (strain ARSEF 2679) TaxID=1081104 RepID=A0A167ZDI8_CORFA|nr:Fungal transcriptional regulatory protein [Cordyceps fumosorosea ARSEF 2679]OAA67376.1 Fungal transcriptional regulatory protein [Cordyceps fumosorosea ARSEF 2679]
MSQCTNERPHCRKCTSSGRECEGYERERVFITGTPEDRGRVASHPKRVTSSGSGSGSGSGSKKQQLKQHSKSPQPKRERSESHSPKFAQTPLNNSAWDDNLDLSRGGKNIAALHTSLHTVVRSPGAALSGSSFGIALPPYSPIELHGEHHNEHVASHDAPLWVSAKCLLCHHGIQGDAQSAGYCLFLFEQASPSADWGLASESMIKRLGPLSFTSFPNHQFFVRVYRPIGVCLAVLNRRETFLSDSEWTSLPWKNHRKSSLDALFDIMLRLPPVLAQTDALIPQTPSVERRYKAQTLLHTCLMIERQFAAWLGHSMGDVDHLRAVESAGAASLGAATTYEFHDELTAFTMLYYWMSQIIFHRCVLDLLAVVGQPVLDPYTGIWLTAPPPSGNNNMQLDPSRYHDGREMAAKICRGLDSALSLTAQPDMLVAPMTVALDFYHNLQMTSGGAGGFDGMGAQDGVYETIELELFRTRLVAKGQGVADNLQGQMWDEIAQY